MIKWLNRVMGKGGAPAPPDRPTYSDLALSEACLLDQVISLEDQVSALTVELSRSEEKLVHARGAHSAVDRRAHALRTDWPALYTRYFTREGDEQRRLSIPTSPRGQRKQKGRK